MNKTVLFCIQKWNDIKKKKKGRAPFDEHTIGALEALGHSSRRFYYDELIERGVDINKELVATCELTGPSAIVMSVLVQIGDANIKPETYKHIRDDLNIPVFCLWQESAQDCVRVADLYAESITKNVFLDTFEYWKKFTKCPDKCMWLPEPKDPRVFTCYREGKASISRDVDVSFVGKIISHPDRAMNIGWLWSNGVPVRKLGGWDESPLHVRRYSQILQRSRITLNFTSANTFEQLKGRTSEALLCGAMLFETMSSETSRLLTPFRDYVPFEPTFSMSPDGRQLIHRQGSDMLDKLIFYLTKGRSEAERIAEQGHKKGKELFDGRLFWQRVFEIVDEQR